MTCDFRVLTYNIHKGIDASNRRYVLRQIQQALHSEEADILILQEIVETHARYADRFSDWEQLPQFHFLAGDNWEHVVYGENAVHRHGSHGNAILSRFPVRQWQNIDVSRNRLEQRGLLHAELNLPWLDQPVHICCVHLNLLGSDRKKQLTAILNHLETTIPENAPLIIGGDFNDWRRRACRQLFQGIGVKDSYKETHGQYADTFPARRPLLSLDRIYFKNLHVKDAHLLKGSPWNKLSDHLPVVAEFDSLLMLGNKGPERSSET